MRSIYDFTIEELEQYFIEMGEKPFRATQIFEWIYRHKINLFEEMTNQKKDIITFLNEHVSFSSLPLVTHQVSTDGTQKFLFRLSDGYCIETVLMNHNYGNSLCVTTQVGCNLGCGFCASGMKKKIRDLTAGEIVNQVVSVSKILEKDITHIVVMGIGEPFDNYDNVLRFLKIVNYPKGLEIGARHISISTCGIVPKIYEFAKEKLQSNLAISLHAPNDEIRNKIMKVNHAYPITLLIQAVKDYIEITNRRVTIEYILLRDINDKKEHALELAKLLKGMNVYINLIPYNEVKEKPYHRSTEECMRSFFDVLRKNRLNVTLRQEQGHDIDAACGQLRGKYE